MRVVWAVLIIVLPASLRRRVGVLLLGWDVHPTAYIGRSLILVDKLTMGPGAAIGPRNVIRNLAELRLGAGAAIATRNWIIGSPLSAGVFPHSPRRFPALILGEFAMITDAHEIDCSDRVELGAHAGLVGYRSQVITHGFNLVRGHLETSPVEIGDYSAVMTACVLMSGTRVPSRAIVSAGSVVNTRLKAERTFYRGNPAEPVRELPEDLDYFVRGTPRYTAYSGEEPK